MGVRERPHDILNPPTYFCTRIQAFAESTKTSARSTTETSAANRCRCPGPHRPAEREPSRFTSKRAIPQLHQRVHRKQESSQIRASVSAYSQQNGCITHEGTQYSHSTSF